MFPDSADFPDNNKDLDAWLGKLPTSSFTPKLWYMIGASHCGLPSEAVKALGEAFEVWYPMASVIAKKNEEQVTINEVH